MLMSQDRFCLYRPTKGLRKEEGVYDEQGWKTRGNLHLDLHPWNYILEASEEAVAVEDLSFETMRDFSRETNMVTAAKGPHFYSQVD